MDLIIGRLDVCTTINCNKLQRALAAAGRPTDVAGGRDANRWFLRASDGQQTVTLPAVIRDQMLTELMTPDTLIGAVRAALAATAADPDPQTASTLVTYADERSVWEADDRCHHSSSGS